jgi:hypothetical protein
VIAGVANVRPLDAAIEFLLTRFVSLNVAVDTERDKLPTIAVSPKHHLPVQSR